MEPLEGGAILRTIFRKRVGIEQAPHYLDLFKNQSPAWSDWMNTPAAERTGRMWQDVEAEADDFLWRMNTGLLRD